VLSDWYAAVWLVFTVVWLVAAAASKRTVRRETRASRAIHATLLLAAFLILLKPWWLGPLDVRFIPDTRATALGGLVLTAAGVAFAIWARLTIGRNWSGTVTVKEHHQLIRHGPYRIVRHPIYSGILLAAAGTAVGQGKVPCFMSLPMAFLAFWVKSRTEERFMTEQFGAAYVQYQHEVKAIIPGVL
jgi:protein-S-isoprenylcysteine O-methyltransferase Ste14